MMAFEQLEFVEAIEELAKIHHVEVPREAGHKAKTYVQGSADDYSQMQKAAQIYQQQLSQHSHAAAYVAKRGLSASTIEKYGIGYAPDSWDLLLKQLGANKASRDQLFELKLTNRNENGREYDFFRERLMFPIRDKRGRVIAFGGRVLGDGTPKYLNSPETEVFEKGKHLFGLDKAADPIRRADCAIVVEGYFDVIALHAAGVRHSVAALGTALGSQQITQLCRCCDSRRIVLNFDADGAAQVRPQADLFLAAQDGVLETVDGEVHGVLLKRLGWG